MAPEVLTLKEVTRIIKLLQQTSALAASNQTKMSDLIEKTFLYMLKLREKQDLIIERLDALEDKDVFPTG